MLIVFYSGITPGRIDMWESGMMVLAYALYSIVVCRRSFVVEPVANMCARVISVLNMSEDNVRFTMVDEEGGDRQAIELGNVTSNTERTESMEKMEEEFKNSSGPEGLELKLPGGLEEKVNPEMKEDFQEERRGSLDSLEVPLTMSHHQNHGREQKRQPSTGWARWLTRGFDVLKFPLQMAFKYTIPNPDSFNFQYCFVLTFAMSVVWLALLTFLVVDLSEKFGTCIGISEDLIGLSVLAVGSSLPDCISSVLIAMECKGDMAVCNALGSNCFDILLCLGATFFLQSCLQNGASIQVENDPAFDSLILLLFIIQGVFNGIIAWSGHYLRRWHGYTLLVVYFLFVIYFFLDYEVIDPETK
uniref:Sodium/calcium exchanger membrane region domain-containing protein n=2 Tax=Amorphochlora amoebiformis TaxID=1561963 RepID=A0A7S0DJ16_9EUKA|mmetsp:Transcript_28128/g.44785  ORF Transcript_28128/g.44785 Transcript_28128/m.44785 type:complete len:359 (+) Transcript_28128:76-1152(+)